MNIHFSSPISALSPASFYILLCLFCQDRHGYDILKQVEKDSQASIKMGPGTLYGALKRLLDNGWIAESSKASSDEPERRRYYRITEDGRKALGVEMQRLEELIKLGQTRLDLAN